MKRLKKSVSRLLLEGFVNFFLQHVTIYDGAICVQDFMRRFKNLLSAPLSAALAARESDGNWAHPRQNLFRC
jgi:hypothetical protein